MEQATAILATFQMEKSKERTKLGHTQEIYGSVFCRAALAVKRAALGCIRI